MLRRVSSSILLRGCLVLSFAACVGCAADRVPEEPAPASAEQPLAETELHTRLKRQIASIVGSDSAQHDWDALLSADVPWNGVHVWSPGTDGWASDQPDHRAMGAMPTGLETYGPAVEWNGSGAAPKEAWMGVPSSQAHGGELFEQRGIFSALDVFATAWPDALAIVAKLGSNLRGAWLVGHSAGALPALLAGLIGGAHRVDVYGVPSLVGLLDGDDGIVHLHTDSLDPTGAMGWIRPDGTPSLNLGSAFFVTLMAGGLNHHDYRAWPAPSP